MQTKPSNRQLTNLYLLLLVQCIFIYDFFLNKGVNVLWYNVHMCVCVSVLIWYGMW